MARVTLDFISQALFKATTATLILPDGNHEAPSDVLFLLHGLSDDHTMWGRRTSIERYAQDRNVVIVMPDGGRSFYLDAHEGAAYGTALGVELPELIKRRFVVKPDGWVVAGLSMGGYGALRIGLPNPKQWRAAHSFSGAVGYGAPDYRPDWAERMSIFGPEPRPDADLQALALDTTVRLSFDCGTEDFLLDQNRAFRDHLVAKGVPHQYEEHDGGHDWSYWDRHVQTLLDREFPIMKE